MVAEREGFEPPVGSAPTIVFKTIAFNHSAISPEGQMQYSTCLQDTSRGDLPEVWKAHRPIWSLRLLDQRGERPPHRQA